MTGSSRQHYKYLAAICCIFSVQSVTAAPVDCNASLVATLTSNLSFGDYVGTNGGTITVDTGGIRTATAGVILMGGTVTAATYTFSNVGKNCEKKWIHITSIPTSISISGPASMTVNNFVTSVAGAGNKFKIKDTPTITIGADLNTINSQATGSYIGNFSIDFNY